MKLSPEHLRNIPGAIPQQPVRLLDSIDLDADEEPSEEQLVAIGVHALDALRKNGRVNATETQMLELQ